MRKLKPPHDHLAPVRKDKVRIPYTVPVHTRLSLGNLLGLLVFAAVVVCCTLYVVVALATANVAWPFQT